MHAQGQLAVDGAAAAVLQRQDCAASPVNLPKAGGGGGQSGARPAPRDGPGHVRARRRSEYLPLPARAGAATLGRATSDATAGATSAPAVALVPPGTVYTMRLLRRHGDAPRGRERGGRGDVAQEGHPRPMAGLAQPTREEALRQRQLHVATHPLIAVHLTLLRAIETGPAHFRELLGELTALLAYEALADLPLAGAPDRDAAGADGGGADRRGDRDRADHARRAGDGRSAAAPAAERAGLAPRPLPRRGDPAPGALLQPGDGHRPGRALCSSSIRCWRPAAPPSARSP